MRNIIFATLTSGALVACVSAVSVPHSSVTALLIVENQRTDDEWVYLEREGIEGASARTGDGPLDGYARVA